MMRRMCEILLPGLWGSLMITERLTRSSRPSRMRIPVWWRAAEALGELGSSRALEPLKSSLDDEDAVVQEAAGVALARLG